MRNQDSQMTQRCSDPSLDIGLARALADYVGRASVIVNKLKPTTSLPPRELRHALQDLAEIMEEAVEEGYRLPTENTLSNVKRALARAYTLCRDMLYDVYPMEDGSVMVQGNHRVEGKKRTAMIQCKPDGSAICSYFCP